MNIWYFVIAGIAAAIAALVWYFKFYRPKQKAKEKAVLTVYSDTVETTPAGATVASKRGVSAELKRAIDYGLAEKFADARAQKYTQLLEHSNYVVYVIPPDREYDSNGNYVPNFRLRADEYDGTEYDQNPRPGIGEIYAAEFVIPESLGAAKGEMVIAEYTREFDTTAANAVGNGADHLILYLNDFAKFEATKFHGDGTGHPLIPPRNQLVRLFAGAVNKLSCRPAFKVKVEGGLNLRHSSA